MIEIAPDRVMVKSPMTMSDARELLDVGKAVLRPDVNVFDLSAVKVADSSAVAVMLGWMRAAGEQGAKVEFHHVPSGVRSLAELYGVDDLLPII